MGKLTLTLELDMTNINPEKVIEAVRATQRALAAVNPKWAAEAAELHRAIILSARKI